MPKPYMWEVAITPRGVQQDLDSADSPEEADVLAYLMTTEQGRAELNAMGYELKYPNIKSLVKALKSKGLVTVRFLHDMESELQ